MKAYIEKKESNIDKRKMFIILTGILLIIALVVGASYAYLKIESRQQGENKIATLCLDIVYEEDASSAINLEEAYPISDTDGQRLAPYKFTITNKCAGTVTYQVNLDILTDVANDTTALDLEHIKMSLNAETPSLLSSHEDVSPITETAYSSKEIASGEVRHGKSVSYDLRLWIDEDTTIEEGANKYFSSKIVITGTSNNQIVSGDLQLAVYVDNKEVSEIPERGAYTVSIDCKGNGTGFWDYNNWGAVVTNFTSGANCDVDFTSKKYFSDYIIDAAKTDTSIVNLTQAETIQTAGSAVKEYRYSGKTVNNWVCFGSEEETCPEDNLYRIIGVIPTQSIQGGEYENRVKLIKNAYYTESESGYLKTHTNAPGGSGYLWNTSASNQWEGSTLKNAVLNSVYWNNLGEYQSYIDPTVWYLGAPYYNSYTTYTPEQFYEAERSDTAAKSGGVLSTVANIGLMYPSDYGFSIENTYWGQSIYNNRTTYVNNAWLYATNGKYEWMLSPESSYSDSNGVDAWPVGPDGYVGYHNVSISPHVFGVRPVFNLKSEVMYNGGTGTSSDPYRIIIGQ